MPSVPLELSAKPAMGSKRSLREAPSGQTSLAVALARAAKGSSLSPFNSRAAALHYRIRVACLPGEGIKGSIRTDNDKLILIGLSDQKNTFAFGLLQRKDVIDRWRPSKSPPISDFTVRNCVLNKRRQSGWDICVHQAAEPASSGKDQQSI